MCLYIYVVDFTKKRMPRRIYMSAYAYVNKYLIGKIKKLL